jgi:outer membrane protein assembly factor BamB
MVNRRNFLRGAVVAAAAVGGAGGNVLAGTPVATAGGMVGRLAGSVAACTLAGPVNGGFEEPVVEGRIPGWTRTFGRATTFAVVDTRASEGTHSLRIVDNATDDALGLRSDLVAAVEGEFHLASAQAYLEQGSVALYLYFYDAAGASLATYSRSFSTVEDGWQTIAVGATAPARATQAAVLVYSPAAARSTFHVDDVRVERLGARVENFGPSALTAAMLNLVIHDGCAYTATRGVLAEIDLATRTLRRVVPFGGDGSAWGMTVSNGRVFFGVELDAYVFDPANGELRPLGSLGSGAGTTWCMTTAPDGMVYAGVYPAGQVWEISPTTETLRNLGTAVPGQQYARVVAADDTHVYTGTQPAGHVVAYDRTTGEKRDVTAPLEGLPGVTVMITTGGRVVYGAGAHIVDMRPDGSDVRLLSLPEGITDAMAVGTDGTLYLTGRATGSVYKRVGDELVPIATPITLEETRALFALDERTLLGAGGSGALWWVDIETAEVTMLDLADLGLAEPEPAQSITLGHDGRTAYVAGSSIVTAHGPRYAKPLRFRVPGQSKQMRFVNGHLYAATYPRTEIIELNIRINRARSLGVIGRPQYRPLAMEYDPISKYLLVGTAPVNGQLAGALTLVDIRRRTLEVLTDILHDQAVASIAVDDGIAYLAGDAQGVSVPPTQASATIAAFDIVNRRKLWEVAPLEGHRSIAGIAVHDGVLYGVNKRISGTWFTMDLRTRQILSRGQLPGTHSYGELTVHRDRVYAAVHDGLVFLLGPDLDEPRIILDGLTDGFPQTLPQLVFEPDTWHAWSMNGLDLARLNLEPGC